MLIFVFRDLLATPIIYIRSFFFFLFGAFNSQCLLLLHIINSYSHVCYEDLWFLKRNLSYFEYLFILFASPDTPLVFKDRIEAFQMLKKVRESRVKAFDTYDEALRFSKCGLENSPESEVPTIIISAEVNGNQINNISNNNSCDKTATKGTFFFGFIQIKFKVIAYFHSLFFFQLCSISIGR